MPNQRRSALTAFFVLAAAPALAHEGHHEHMAFPEALHHLLAEPDHKLALAGLIVVAVTGTWTWFRLRARR